MTAPIKDSEQRLHYGTGLDITFKLLSFALTCLIGVLVWSMNTALSDVASLQGDVQKLKINVAQINANRYTAHQALLDSQRSQQQLTEFRSWIESHYPPKYLLEAVQTNNSRIDRMQEDLDQRLDLIRKEIQLIRQEMAKSH